MIVEAVYPQVISRTLANADATVLHTIIGGNNREEDTNIQIRGTSFCSEVPWYLFKINKTNTKTIWH